MLKIGELTSKVDRLINDVGAQSEKIDAVRHQVSFVKGALWIIGVVIVCLGGLLAWYVTGKLSIKIGP